MSGSPQNELVAQLTAEFSSRKPIRAGSLITTVFGDAVAPRGGTLWLGSLLPLLHALGINDSQARTAMSRLTDDEWFCAARVGRKSYYTLTNSGRTRFDAATRRIYSGPPHAWSGVFCLVIAPGGASVWRDQLRKELSWIGFGTLSPGVFIHPDPDEPGLQAVLARVAPPEQRPVLIRGVGEPATSASSLAQMVDDCWDLKELATAYQGFVTKFGALGGALADGAELTDWDCLLARMMLIHEYRRIILRDPLLPTELLPPDWAGTQARRLTRDIYERIVEPSEQWVSTHFEREDGALPSPNRKFWQRFGGLAR